MTDLAAVVVERDDTGRVFKIPVGPQRPIQHTRPGATPKVRN